MKFIKLKEPLFQWGPVDACINFIYYPGEAAPRQSAEFFKCPTWPKGLFLLRNNSACWIVNNEQLIKNSLLFTERYILNDEKRKWTKEILNNSLKKIENFLRKLESLNLKRITDKEFYFLYKKATGEHEYFWAVWSPIEMMTIGLEEMMRKELIAIKDEAENKNALSILTSTSHLTFYRQENKELLKIALNKNQKRINDELSKHAKKYFWMLNNYKEANILDQEYFKEELNKIIVQMKEAEIRERIKEIKSYCQQVEKDKEKLIKKHNLSFRIKKLTSFLDECIWWQDIRKERVLKIIHYFNLILKEIGRRKSFALNDLKLLTPFEVENLLAASPKKNKIFSKIIAERKKGTVFYFTNKRSLEVKDNKIKKSFFSFYIEKVPQNQVSIIEGILASSGPIRYFKGPVKIIKSVDELSKLQKGDILATVMTSPDYIVGIRKSGAIITDEGGLTCHAAIVARELNKPCIVGTKIATKVLKDGQIVELHTARGVIKIFSF